MFRPRHAYRSPITSRYRGKAKGCPVFNNLININSNMVEQHDECLECLAKIKNRTDLYKTLADNNKPSNNVIKLSITNQQNINSKQSPSTFASSKQQLYQQSLQRLSSSASNNRLKTCLQFLIIKVNEKSISTPHQPTTTITNIGSNSSSSSPKSNDFKEVNSRHAERILAPDTVTPPASASVVTIKHQNNSTKKQKFHNQQHKQRQQQQLQNRNQSQKQKQLASPIQDQVSSTQDQIGPTQDDHDCQTSPMMLVSTQVDEDHHLNHCSIRLHDKLLQDSLPRSHRDDDQHEMSPAQTQSSPALNYASATTTTTSTSTSTTTNTSPSQTDIIDGATIFSNNTERNNLSDSQITNNSSNITTNNINNNSNINNRHSTKRKKLQNSSDHDNSSTASWSSSYASPSSPISTSSTSSISSSSHSSSSCSSSLSPTPSPSPLSSPDIVNELKGPRLKLSEEKIRRIKRRPILFDDYYTEHSFASTPTTSSGCSPGQHSNTTQNSDQSRIGIPTCNMVIHMFQAPPKFVNNLKPCNLPPRPKEPTPVTTPPVPVKEMLNCAICGIKDKPPNMSKTYGQISCPLCTRFFAAFLKRPQQLYCAQDGDCLMTFDSRCQACWIKICLQKFDIEEEHRKVGQKYSPKLLSAPNVSLITIDTSLSR